eukprot:GFYU01005022.1.p1 GENE.GFYU01005022.1~~GFYU01005022.1.p1  ORF type:complete len:372 (+),score=140.86 GFYU01005022.1:150-1265(+)
MKSEERQYSYVHTPLALHKDQPKGFELLDDHFDEDIHLQLEPPSQVKTLNFENVPFPYENKDREDFPGLAYTPPFRMLSDEGVKAFKDVFLKHQDKAVKHERIPFCVRGHSYRSPLVREFSTNKKVLKCFSDLAQKPIGVHNVHMNMGHTNRGDIATGKNVDQWHNDSVDYVMVLILSDIAEMQGGDLQVVQVPNGRDGAVFAKLKTEGIPDEIVETVNYAGAGYCIFMQGSKILHQVLPVLKAREPRISFINSYQTLDVFEPDLTLFHTGRDQSHDAPHVVNVEYARHRAWRVHGRMQWVMEELKWGTPPEEIARIMAEAGQELVETAKLLTDQDLRQEAPFFVESKDKRKAEAEANGNGHNKKTRTATK